MSLTADIESIGYIVLVTAWVCPAIVLPVFALRLFAATRVLKRWHCDDTFMVLSVIFAIGNSVVSSIQVQNGLGNRIADVSIETLREYFKLNITGSMTTYNLAAMCTKSSILLYYLRFPSSRGFQLATYLVLIVSVGYTTSGVFAWAYNCSPIEKSWDKSLEGSCIDSSAALLARAVFNVVTDFAILLLPIWLLWPLRLWSVWHKLGVLIVLMAGGFVCVASILRLAAFWTDKGANEEDMTWHSVKNANWCLMEAWVGVFCACLPSLKVLFVRHFPGIFSSDRHVGNRGSMFSMIQIPVTVDNVGGNTSEGVASARRVMSGVRKKPSYGSSEPDLETDRVEGFAESRWSNSDEEQGRQHGEGHAETIAHPRPARMRGK
ncbi:hypothetical protein B0T14DRAFT_564175 [Immersiella caudata]|uniref:Rhodopsin domain-containing protein n=1 Tax=Immersiella caudata TaxID=314043 RepID=A0AA39WW65_9PEZI|nr:hypothetical protein B0T14DRAFT_564175 [Immersiella caudata]